MAAPRESLNIRVDRFWDWVPEQDRCIGENITRYHHLWREAEGGSIINYEAAERFANHLPQEWGNWALTLLDELAEDGDFWPVLQSFGDFVLIFLTWWIEPPIAHAEPLNAILFAPPEDPGRVDQALTPPPPPHTPPPMVPPVIPAPDAEPATRPPTPIPDPYGIHEQGYIDHLSLVLALPAQPAAEAPAPPPPHRRMARITTVLPTETFHFTITDPPLPGPSNFTSDDEDSYESDETSGSWKESESGDEWFAMSDSEED